MMNMLFGLTELAFGFDEAIEFRAATAAPDRVPAAPVDGSVMPNRFVLVEAVPTKLSTAFE